MKVKFRNACWLILPLVGCRAQLGDMAANGESGARPGTLAAMQEKCGQLGEGIHPGPAPIRRLTHFEYDRTLKDLTGVVGQHSSALPQEARALGFHGVAEAQSVSSLLIEGYETAAIALAKAATTNLPGLLGCDPAIDSCVEDFVREFGARAYRRPLTNAEVGRMTAVFAWGRDNLDVTEGVRMVIEVFLQSPDFLYRPEIGGADVVPGVKRLTSYEMATRLAYLLLGSMPDAALLKRAAADDLQSKEAILEEARRLLGSQAAHDLVRQFHTEWLDLAAVRKLERDPAVYPGYSDEIPLLLEQETLSFIETVVFDEEGTLEQLLTAPFSMMNADLASFYGVTGPTGSEFEKVPLDGTRRGGLLTQASLLAHHAQPLQTSPVHRGKFVRESILCQFLLPPPADLVIVPPELDPNLTTRERFGQHSADAACRGCHSLMDPIGLGFENFDSVGRFRDSENGKPIDASGEIVDADVEGKFVGAVELGQKLAGSEEVQLCMTRQWVRYAQGRSETLEDSCSIASLGEGFQKTGGNILGLIESLTQTDAFLYKKVEAP